MSSEERNAFCWEFSIGLSTMIISYALMTGLRSFRDFYPQQIFSAAMKEDNVPSWVFFIVDLPGAILSCFALVFMNRIEGNQTAIRMLFLFQISACAFAFASTLLFEAGLLSGMIWQVTLGIGIFVSYTLMQTPVFDRLFAATKTKGTCTFLIFMSDFFGYIATVVLLFYQNFGPETSSGDDGNQKVLDLYKGVLFAGLILITALLATSLVFFGNKLKVYDENGKREHVENPQFGDAEDSEGLVGRT